jgi:hypothetical protein
MRSQLTKYMVSGTYMAKKVRIALDAMGGDIGPSAVIPGAAISLTRHPDSEFVLFGDSMAIERQLEAHPALKAASRVVHTDVTISMKEKPSQALRHGRKNSSMWLTIDAVKKGEADVAVSAGNTGALMAMALFNLRMLPGIDPPEPIVNGMIDLGRVATDALFLGIDPYPRKPDAVFDQPEVAADAEDHPFAALKALKAGKTPPDSD